MRRITCGAEYVAFMPHTGRYLLAIMRSIYAQKCAQMCAMC